MRKSIVTYGIILGAVFLMAGINRLYSQWSNNPYKNTVICDLENEQIQPKIAATSDGGCYIAWFDSRNGMYAVYIQKLDSKGIKQWGENGLLISNKNQDSWLTDNCLIADKDDNAVIVFADKREGQSLGVSAYKISPEGEYLWGETGVYLSNYTAGTYFEHSPKVVQVTDGAYIVVWETIGENDINSILVQKLSPEGNKMYPNGNVSIHGTLKGSIYARVVPSDDGSALIAFMQYSQSELVKNDNMELIVQKISKDGNVLFPLNNDLKSGIRLNTTPGIIYFIRPFLVRDNSNGAFIGWQDLRDGGLNYGSYIQHITQDGAVTFPDNGITGVDNFNSSQLHPTIAVNRNTNESYLFWIDNSIQSGGSNRLMCQKYNNNGSRVWTSGTELFELPQSEEIPDYKAIAGNSGIFVIIMYSDNYNSECRIECRKMGWDGEMQWNNPVLLSGTTGKVLMEAVVAQNDMCIAVWVDKRKDNGGIYAQNIYSSGKIGDESNNIEFSDMQPEGISINPYPLSGMMQIAYKVNTDGLVRIKIFDLNGNEIQPVFNGYKTAGDYTVIISTESMPAGCYFCIMASGGKTYCEKLIIIY